MIIRRILQPPTLLAGAALAAALLLGAVGGCSGGGSPSGASSADGSAETSVATGIVEPSKFETPTLPLAGKVPPPAEGAYLGVYVPPAPFEISALDDFEARTGRKAAIVMWYQPWAAKNRSKFDSAACLAVMRRGKVPMITWEPWDPGNNANTVKNPSHQAAYRLAAINNGTYDAYIRSWARDIKALGGPVMLRPMHEMNGSWYPWSGTANGNKPREFVAAWRRIHDIFDAEGATNVTWVWSINHEPVPDNAENAFSAYYPGDSYVDWTAVSGFNFGTTSPYSTWQPFRHWYDKPLGYLTKIDKPICVAEFATVEKGGSKAAWIDDAYKQIRSIKKIKAVIYYDAAESGGSVDQDWRVGTSAKSLTAFQKAIAPAYFVSGPTAELSAWGNSLTTDHWRYLDTLTPIY